MVHKRTAICKSNELILASYMYAKFKSCNKFTPLLYDSIVTQTSGKLPFYESIILLKWLNATDPVSPYLFVLS